MLNRFLSVCSVAALLISSVSLAPGNTITPTAIAAQTTTPASRTIGNSMIANASEAKFYDWAMQMANLVPVTAEAGNLREALVGQVIYTAMEQGQLDASLQGIDQLPAGSEARNDWRHRAISLALKQDKGDRAI